MNIKPMTTYISQPYNAHNMHGIARLVIPVITMLLTVCTNVSAATLGEWTHYYAYNNLTHVVPTNKEVYAVSAGRLMSYNPNDDTVNEFNTINSLSNHRDITDICWNKTTQQLIIAYENGDIDMMSTKDHTVTNAAAIANEVTSRSKEIQTIYCSGIYAYIVMPYGVVVLNTKRKEFDDTYRFDISPAKFTGAWVENDTLFLQANKALDSYNGSDVLGGKLNTNLLDKNKWKGIFYLRGNEIKKKIHTEQNARNIYDVKYPHDKNSVYVVDSYNNCHWSADSDGLLMRYKQDTDATYTPQWTKGRKPYGPESNNFFTLRWYYGQLYTVGEGWHNGGNGDKPAMIQVFNPSGNTWCSYEIPSKETLGLKFQATSDITVDPRDTSHVMVGAKSGLYEYRNGKFVKHWDYTNSPIKRLGTNAAYQMVLGTIYDSKGNLWALNSFSTNGLLRLQQTFSAGVEKEATWTTMKHPEIDVIKPYERYLSNPIFDSKGRLWFINQNIYHVSFYCYTPETDNLMEYQPSYNQDATQMYNNSGDGFLRDINIDPEGNVWLCGTKGVCYLPAKNVGQETNVMYQHKIARDDGTGLADYLLSTVDATCIIFDQAGRKYIGTSGNGVYVISADNNSEVENYTTSNSNIMSDNINFLALDSRDGTLYCSTDKGLCSVKTDGIAVPATLDKDNIRVYPNPVRPEYTGMITFEGVTVGADVKITTATGAIVHSGRTTSAVYQWDGCDQAGNRCASGVYNVLLATEDGSEGCVAKVAMIK